MILIGRWNLLEHEKKRFSLEESFMSLKLSEVAQKSRGKVLLTHRFCPLGGKSAIKKNNGGETDISYMIIHNCSTL